MRSIGTMRWLLAAGLAATGCAADTSGVDLASQASGSGGSHVAGSGGAAASGGSTAGTGGARNFNNAGIGGSAGAAFDRDGAVGDDGGLDTCGLGSAGSFATDESLDLFGEVTYFHAGKPLPDGRYRVQYEGGCMKYSANQDWAVHAFQDGSDAFWLVGDTTAQRLTIPPGTFGFLVGMGGHASFEECVTANLALEPVEFEFAGGKLGLWLQDSPYSDNLAGVDGSNPTWSLTLLGDCAELE
jgi:hypothetical protein